MKYLVSVYIATFNHEKYIEKCISSILSQVTNFDYEIIIHDDCSTDKTAALVNTYEKKDPNIFKTIYQSTNQNSINNSVHLANLQKYCDGKYIALCDGDDYWIDDHKLQKQVDFMESNLSYSMCFGKVKSTFQTHEEAFYYSTPKKTSHSFYNIATSHVIPTSVLLFRKSFIPNNFPFPWIKNIIFGDLVLELVLASRGSAYFFDQFFGVYRKHPNGISVNPLQIKLGRKSYILMYKELRKIMPIKYYLILSYMLIRTRIGGIIK